VKLSKKSEKVETRVVIMPFSRRCTGGKKVRESKSPEFLIR